LEEGDGPVFADLSTVVDLSSSQGAAFEHDELFLKKKLCIEPFMMGFPWVFVAFLFGHVEAKKDANSCSEGALFSVSVAFILRPF
jgi:hypothetical protein